jgi:hypothetical protein
VKPVSPFAKKIRRDEFENGDYPDSHSIEFAYSDQYSTLQIFLEFLIGHGLSKFGAMLPLSW